MSDIADRIHKRLIETIVMGLSDQPLVLKGGTALMLAYHVDRYSEDIDYDSNTKVDLAGHLEEIMQKTRMQYDMVTKKHTDTTSRVFVNYSTERVKEEMLRVEVKNNLTLQPEEIQNNPGFPVYSLNHLCRNKINTTKSRIKPRDLYDLGYISRHYKSKLNDKNLDGLRNISKDKTLHSLYRTEWNEDKYVRDRSFDATITALNSVKSYIQNPHDQVSAHPDIM